MTLPNGFLQHDDASAGAARPLHLLQRAQFDAWSAAQPVATRQWMQAQGFDAMPGTLLLLPAADGGLAGAVAGIGDALDPVAYGHLPAALPPGAWYVAGMPDAATTPAVTTPAATTRAATARAATLGWGLGSYRFTRYRSAGRAMALLLVRAARAGDPQTDDPQTDDPGLALHADTIDLLAACLRVRDLVNTPAQDMGPQDLHDTVAAIAAAHGARCEVVIGEALQAGFPAIHAVGRASPRAPRLLQLHWGDAAHPHLVLVGKGVCFDTGGLDLKAADGMRNMKKDMGGAAHAIALAELVMQQRLPYRLTLIVAAVDNAIGPDAFRPGDVLATRMGVQVEIDNTDAEGRLVLGDALTLAGELQPDLLLDFATLTGAARVALGPDLPALYSNDDALADGWLSHGAMQRDPVWRMPLWRPYLRYLTSNVADIANSGPSKMAGSITAALYLERFVPAGVRWAHLDVYSWNDSDRPGRPAGGEAQGLRAVFAMLQAGVPGRAG